MKFGPVPVDEAVGTILAHSLHVGDLHLRKGNVLGSQEIRALRDAKVQQVIVAQLDPGDVDENVAATRLAAALLEGCDTLHATEATTGRVNLIADTSGVLCLDPDAIEKINLINPMISLATVAHHFQMAKGAMAGTVKIIAYAVPESDLQAACAAARGAIRLIAPLKLSADLIVTQVKENNDESKGIAATRARLEMLGADLQNVTCVRHTETALAAEISRSSADLVLILTGSATSDPYDVGPQALRLAGGQVTRFGMPVDPGNLLFLGHINERPVVGLPGCARSPALNGADLVLSRILCGIEVTSKDIAAMGVGGLLKEIPTRPSPRRT